MEFCLNLVYLYKTRPNLSYTHGVSSPLGAGGEEFGSLAHVGFVVSLFARCVFLLLLMGGGG